jgi:peptidoglycan/LPS O-acetylase OafA/YrhL
VGTRKVPALTGIRFFAAFYVFIMHYGATALDKAGAPRPVATFLHNGIAGVSVFFVLSGFILTHAHPERFTAPQQYADYFISRFARIYPVYLLALVLALPLALDHPRIRFDPRTAAAVLAMVQSWTDAFAHSGYAWIMQAWTLSVEFFFYLSFPFLINLVRRLGRPVLLQLCVLDAGFMMLGGTATITPWIDFGGNVHDPAWPLYLPLPLTRSGEFVFGMLLQTLVSRAPRVSGAPVSACLLMTAAMVALLAVGRSPMAVSLASVLAGLLIAFIYVSDNGFTRLLGSRALVLLGSASYALYLLQGPCHAYLSRLVPAPYDHLLAFPVTLAAALLTWRFVEEPARRSIWGLRRQETGATASALPSPLTGMVGPRAADARKTEL